MSTALIFLVVLAATALTGGVLLWLVWPRLQRALQQTQLHSLQQVSQQLVQLNQQTLHSQQQQQNQDLEGKKQLIDQHLGQLSQQVTQAQELMRTLEKDRENKFAELTKQLQHASQQTDKLQTTTQDLRAALSNSRVRGQWGERMAEDVLRMAGFIEGINYHKQQQLTDGSKPDFTFLLPGQRVVHMDVKFPLEAYLAYLEAPSPTDQDAHKKAFLREARNRIQEASKRAYVDPAQGTLDYVLVFIPNEQVYSFLHEHDRRLLDDALQKKVILCSPVTLFAVLAVMRQAVEQFQLSQTTGQILDLLAEFTKQWEQYTGQMSQMGDKIRQTQDAFDKLITTRTNMLERPLNKLQQLRQQQQLTAPTNTNPTEAGPA